jgi:hypothetical protein
VQEHFNSVERTCIVFLQSELDIAFGFLRLAEVETGSGNTSHADELIAKASNSYKAVLDGLATVSREFEEERQVLRERLRLLQDAIRTVARRR